MKKWIRAALPAFQPGNRGAILIVDISGFSRFVQRVNHTVGVQVIQKLLGVIIASNRLGLRISEIEGDAILFYRYGAAPPATAIKAQFELMLRAFSQEVTRMAATVPEAASLSVKMVATYGELTSFQLAGFEKLYGEAVIKAHRLLKNQINSDTYVLLSEELLSQQELETSQAAGIYKKCELYDVGLVCYRYTSYPTDRKHSYVNGRKMESERLNRVAAVQ